jgi:hypothetical protein
VEREEWGIKWEKCVGNGVLVGEIYWKRFGGLGREEEGEGDRNGFNWGTGEKWG